MADADNGWDKSAAAWIASLGDEGDFARRGVLDPRMREAALAVGGRFLDIGCGEGRFVRMLGEAGLSGCGIDPTEALVDAARERDPAGEYHIARAEALPFADAMFDLAVFYLSLIDIDDLDEAIGEAVRVLRPGGSVLIANLSPINTAGSWQRTLTGHYSHYAIDNYLESRLLRARWKGIDVGNWHRPFEVYFASLLGHGLILREFHEPRRLPEAVGKPEYDRVPWLVTMRWDKPA